MEINVHVNGKIEIALDSAAQALLGSVSANAAAADSPVPEPVKKAAVKKETAKKDTPKPVEPATAPAEAEEDRKLTDDELVALRKQVADYLHTHADGKDQVKAWLTENLGEGKKVSDVTTAKLPELRRLIGAN